MAAEVSYYKLTHGRHSQARDLSNPVGASMKNAENFDAKERDGLKSIVPSIFPLDKMFANKFKKMPPEYVPDTTPTVAVVTPAAMRTLRAPGVPAATLGDPGPMNALGHVVSGEFPKAGKMDLQVLQDGDAFNVVSATDPNMPLNEDGPLAKKDVNQWLTVYKKKADDDASKKKLADEKDTEDKLAAAKTMPK